MAGEALERVLAELEERTLMCVEKPPTEEGRSIDSDWVPKSVEVHACFHMSKAASGEGRLTCHECKCCNEECCKGCGG